MTTVKKCNEKRTHDKAAKKTVWEAIVKETKLITACQEMVILLLVPMHSKNAFSLCHSNY